MKQINWKEFNWKNLDQVAIKKGDYLFNKSDGGIYQAVESHEKVRESRKEILIESEYCTIKEWWFNLALITDGLIDEGESQ